MEVTTWSNIARLNVTNRVTGLRTDCTVFPSYGGDNANYHSWRSCSWVYPNPQLEVLYDGLHGNLGLRQTWSCTDDVTKAM